MKRLVLMRHAKSAWDDMNIRDIDRPLNKRGKRVGPAIGQHLKNTSGTPDLVICSSAKRAFDTARLVSKELGYSKKDIKVIDKLYHATPGTIKDVIAGLDESINHVLVVGHNPGMSSVISELAHMPYTDVPTCAFAEIQLSAKKWSRLNAKHSAPVRYEFPKMLDID